MSCFECLNQIHGMVLMSKKNFNQVHNNRLLVMLVTLLLSADCCCCTFYVICGQINKYSWPSQQIINTKNKIGNVCGVMNYD